MRIGVLDGDVAGEARHLDRVLATAVEAERVGLDTFWLPAVFGHDPLVALTVVGREVPRIELGTNIVHAYPVHPLALAEQAMSVQIAVGGRFTLGIGTSHKFLVERLWGMTYQPAAYTREYLQALAPLVDGAMVKMKGKYITCAGQLRHPELRPFPIIVAAMGPQMLRVAGRHADGTSTWMTGPSTLASHVTPAICTAAAEAGRKAPRVVVGVPVLVTDDHHAGRRRAVERFDVYKGGPSYLRMLAHEGWEHPGEAAVVGDEVTVRAELDRYAAAGATDIAAVLFGADATEDARTLAFLAAYRTQLATPPEG